MATPATAALPSPNSRPRSRALAAHPSAGTAEIASFEAHPGPQFFVDAAGHILRANAAGRRLLASGADAAAFAARLVSSSGARMRSLREHIARAVQCQVASPEIELDFSAASSLAIRAIPLGAGFDFALVLARANPSPAGGSASERFNFTPAEALVAARLARGLTVGEIGVQLCISVETVRCHLKQAFVKAGVHRQAELVAVMLRG